MNYQVNNTGILDGTYVDSDMADWRKQKSQEDVYVDGVNTVHPNESSTIPSSNQNQSPFGIVLIMGSVIALTYLALKK